MPTNATFIVRQSSPIAADAPVTVEIARTVLAVVDAGLVKGMGRQVLGQMCVEAAVCYAYGLPHGDSPPCVSRAVRRFKIGLNDQSWSSNAVRASGMRRLAIAQLGSAGVVDDVAFARKMAEVAIRKVLPMMIRALAGGLQKYARASEFHDLAAECEADGWLETARKVRAFFSGIKGAAAADAAAYAAAYAAVAVAADAAAYAAVAVAADADAAAYAAAAVAADAYADAYAVAAAYAAAYADAARDKFLADVAEWTVEVLIEMKSPGCEFLFLTERKAS